MEDLKLDRCYGCGKDNPIGLHLHNTYVENKSHIEFEVKPDYCGYPGLMHGGITATLFDEAMFYAVKKLDIVTVTASITIDYISPAYEGHTLVCEAQVEEQDGRKIDVAGELKDISNGKLIARARGRFLEVDMKRVLES